MNIRKNNRKTRTARALELSAALLAATTVFAAAGAVWATDVDFQVSGAGNHVEGNETDNQTVFGYNNKALGYGSTAWGGNTQSGQSDTENEELIDVLIAENQMSENEISGFGTYTTAWGSNTEAFGTDSTAFGSNTKAHGIYTTAWGNNTLAQGRSATAFGLDTVARGDQAVAWGLKTLADGHNATAFGEFSRAITADKPAAMGATAFGVSTLAMNNAATAFGFQTTAQGNQSTAFGSNSLAAGNESTAFGNSSFAFGDNSLAALGGQTGTGSIGYNFSEDPEIAAFNQYATKISINADGAVAIGKQSVAYRSYTYAIGKDTRAMAKNSLAIGNGAYAYGVSSSLIGAGSNVGGSSVNLQGGAASVYGAYNSVAATTGVNYDGFANSILGVGNTTSNANSSVVLGTGNTVQDSYEDLSDEISAVWNNIRSKENDLITATAEYKAADAAHEAGEISWDEYQEARNKQRQAQTALNNAEAALPEAVKNEISAKGGRAIAIGSVNTVKAKNAIAIGSGATVSGQNSIAIGTGHQISGANSGAFGDPTTIEGNNSYAFGNSNTIGAYENAFIMGNYSKVSANGGVVLGSSGDVTMADGVALGNYSVANRDKNVTGYDPVTGKASTQNNKIWRSTLGAVSVGNDSNTRQIINVAAGSDDTDAVNVAQLKQVATVANSAKTHYYSVKSTVTGAGTNYNNDGATGADAIAAGANAKAKGTGSIAVGYESATSRNYAVAVGDNAKARGAVSIVIGRGAETGVDETDGNFPTASHAIAIGPLASAQGMYSSVMGAYSNLSINRDKTVSVGSKKDRILQGFGATVLGALNSSQTTESGPVYSSVANSIIGTANGVTDSNAALVFGAGNEITNSYQDVLFAAGTNDVEEMLTLYDQAVEQGDHAKMAEVAEKLRGMVTVSGGQVLAIGGSNKASGAYRSQMVGVGNVLEGTKSDTPITIGDYTFNVYSSQYDLLDGFENRVKDSEHVSVIGTANSVENSNSNVIFGDYHGISGGGNNVIIGSNTATTVEPSQTSTTGKTATAHTANISDTVMLGHNADARVSQGVALGSASIAKTEAGVAGYDPATGAASTRTSAAWRSTAAAVSVGNENKTWYGFSESTLQAGINAHKTELQAMGVDTSLAPAALLASLTEEQLKVVTDNVAHETEVAENAPQKDGTIYVAQPGSGTTRQITNVAAGYNDTDAVNVAQLKAASTHYYSVNDNGTQLGNYNNDGAIGKFSVAAGPNTAAQGLLSTVVGANSIATDSLADVLVNMKQASAAAVGTGTDDKQTMMNMVNPVLQKMPSVTSAASTVIGSLNTINNNADSITKANALVNALKNNGGTQIAIKAVQYLDSAKAFDGVSNTLVGNLNTTQDSNGAVIYGTGNSIVNSYENFEPALDAIKNVNIDSIITNLQGSRIQKMMAMIQLSGVFNSLNNMQAATQLQQCIENNDIEGMKAILTKYITENEGKGGRSIAIGTNNSIENARLAQLTGTNNVLKGTENTPATYSIVSGYGNKAYNTNSATVFGNRNTIGADGGGAVARTIILGDNNSVGTSGAVADNIVIGNNRTVNSSNNVIVGGASSAQTTSVNNVVALGYGASVNYAGGVAVGWGSISDRAAGMQGANPLDVEISEADAASAKWKSTAGAFSIGGTLADGTVITRQITGVAAGTEDTDAVNVAQLRGSSAHYYSVNENMPTGGDTPTTTDDNKNNSGATGTAALAAGFYAAASGDEATAFGYSSVSTQKSSSSLGSLSKATEEYATAVGHSATAAGKNSTAVGTDSLAANTNSSAMGLASKAYGEGAIAIGHETTAGAIVAVHQEGEGTNAVYTSEVISADKDGATVVFRSLKEEIDPTERVVEPEQQQSQASTKGRMMLKAAPLLRGGSDAASDSSSSKISVVAYDSLNNKYYAATLNDDGSYTIGDQIKVDESELHMGGVSVGSYAHAPGDRSLSVGRASGAYGDDSTAMGIYANAVGDGALAIGHGSSTGVSVDVTPSGKQGTAEYADGFWTTSIQTDSTGNPIPNGKDGGIAIGSYAHTEGTRAMAVGRVAGAYGTNSMAIGLRSNAYGEGSMAFGHGVTAGSADQKYAAQVAELHDDPTIPYDLDGADGIVSLDNVIGAIAMGSYAEATGRGSLSMGRYSKAQSAYSTAMGIRAVVSADAVNGVAIGREATVEGANSIAIGKQATVTGSDSIAIGTGHTVSGSNSGAIGDPSVISGDNSYAVGNNNTIGDYDGAFIMGNSSDVSASGGVILGSNATVTAEGGVALGDGSAATVGAGVFGYDPLTDKPSTETSAAWKSGAGAVSVGSGDVTRQITNVAAGTNDTDAVNVAQLKRIALTAGEGVSIDEDNKINIDAVTRYAGDFGEQVSVSLDNVLTVKGSAASEKDLTTGNIGVVTDPESQALLVKLNKDVDLGEDGSVKIGNVSISSTNVSMGGNRITNVAPGVNPTDAVNMSQLMGFTGGWYLAVADGEADKIAGDTVRIVVEKNEPVGDLTTDVLSVKKTVNDDGEQVVSFVVADAPTFGGMVTAGGLTVKAKSGDVVINNDGISAGGNKITNVAKGDVNKNSTDAVNGSQLFDLGDSVAQSFGGTSVYNSSTGKVEFNVKLDETGTQNSVAEALQALDTKPVYKHDITMEKNLTVGGTFTSNGPAVFNETVTMKKGLNMSGTRITNLAPGVDDGDAVNVSQLKAIGSNINYQINKMDRDISYTGSRAAALAALHPLPYDPDKPTSIMAGVGHYRGASSVALGVAHHFNDDTLLTVGSTVGRETMLNVGLSLRVGRNTNMTEKRWKAMRYSAANYDAKIKTLEEENSSLRKRLKSLENSVQTLLDAKGRK